MCYLKKCLKRVEKKIIIGLLLFILAPKIQCDAQVDFMSSDTMGCAPLSISFATANQGETYLWFFGDGSSSNLQNPSHLYLNPGSYTVKLIVSNADGSQDSLVSTNYISILNKPIANFSLSNTSVCQNSESITLQNNSLHATSYVWDFGDGVTSTLENPTHSYTSYGSINIKLIAMNVAGCSDVKIVNSALSILPQPTINFVVQNNIICQPQTDAHFSNLTVGCASQVWSFGDGTSSTLQNPIHAYTSIGEYNVSLIVEGLNGCIDTLTKAAFISVVPETHSAITSSSHTGCLPLQINFSTATGVSYQWDFGNGTSSNLANPTALYSSSGTFDVSVIITKENGCVENVELDSAVYVADLPQAAFVVVDDEGCAPLTSQFVNVSQNADSFQWIFGDGHLSANQNTTNTYVNGGTYDVTLKAFNSLGCESSVTVPNAVTVTTTNANFYSVVRTGCAPFVANFIDYSNGVPATYLWDFGDSTFSSEANPIHTYNHWGEYTVKLIVTNGEGCSDTIIRVNYINVINPIENYVTPDTLLGCAPFDILLNNSTVGGNSWIWNFGDGTVSTLQNPNHTYNESGIYTVSLQMGIPNGCTRFYEKFRIIEVSSVNIGFTYTVDCENLVVSFTDTVSNIVSNTWNFFNGVTSTSLSPTQTYSNNGNFSVMLTCTNEEGCSASKSFVNTINLRACDINETIVLGDALDTFEIVQPAYQLFGCAPFLVLFNYPFLQGSVVSWDFGDGSTSMQTNPEHTYSNPGVYTIHLVYENGAGLIDTVSYIDFVTTDRPNFSLDINLNSDCSNYGISINNGNSGPNQYFWNFGDGTYSNLPNPVHIYEANQVNYIVMLTVQDTISGCISTQSNSIVVFSNNNILANKYVTCTQGYIHFYFSESTYQNYLWDFGDGTYSSVQNPIHSYVLEGTYSINLKVVDQFGCERVFYLPSNVVIYKPEANFTYSRTNLCSAKEISFVNFSAPIGIGSGGGCFWTFGDGTTLITPDVSNVTHIYSNAGIYQVSLKVITEGNCSDVMTKSVQVDDTRANFSMVQSKNCYPMTVHFLDQSINAVSWQWNFGNDSLSNSQNPSFYYSTPFVNPISLVITDPRGCHDSIAIFSAHIFTNPIQLSSDSLCLNSTILFTSNQDSIQALWNFGDGSVSTSLNASHLYAESGNYNVSLISVDLNGCIDTSEATIYVDGPAANFVASTIKGCAPLYVAFENNSVGASTFYWDLDDGSNSTAQLPSHIYTTPGVYSVGLIATNTFGCKDTLLREDYIIIDGPTAAFHFEDDSICVGENININVAFNNVTTWQWNFGDGTISIGSQPQHQYLSQGNYIVSLIIQDSLGCSAVIVDSSLSVFELPLADFSLSDTMSCIPAIITANNISNNATSFIWHNGNGSHFISQDASFIFNNEGIQILSLVAINNAGCSDSLSKSIYVLKTPQAEFIAEQTFVCNNSVLNLVNLSQDTLNSTFQWVVSPSMVSTEYNPSFEVNVSGLHDVELVVKNENGCVDTLKKEDYVYVSDGLTPLASEINLVTVVSDNSVSLKWDQSLCSDFYAYVIYRKNGLFNYAPIDTILDFGITDFIDIGLNTLINSYCYKVQTIDRCGNKLDLASLNEHCTIELKANVLENNTIKLTWNAYEGCQVSKYRIDRSANNGQTFEVIDSVLSTQLTFIDSTAYCPIKFVYKVVGVSVCEAPYNSFSDTSAAVPRNVFASIRVDIKRSTVVNNASILTEWLPPQNVPGEIFTYNLYRREVGKTYDLIANLPYAQTSYIDDDVNVNDTRYEYKIAVINQCGVGSIIGERGNSILLQAFKSESSTELRWSPYTSWQEGVEYYIIERKKANGEWEQVQLLDKNKLEIVIEDDY